MKNTDFMNLSLPEGTDKIDVEILNSDFKKLESEASKHYIKQQIEVDGTATIIGSIGPYVQLENLTDNILNVSIGDELVILMKGDNRKIRTISGENYGVVTNGAVRITYYINVQTYADENFYKKEKVDELLKNVEATVEVDAELSETSENPVQNKVITQELASYATTAEVESKVTEKVAEIVAGAPERYNTLKELADWIDSHEDSAASMNSAIQQNKKDISTANTNITKNAEGISTANTNIQKNAKDVVTANENITAVKNDVAINRTTLGTQCKNKFNYPDTAKPATYRGLEFSWKDNILYIIGTATETADSYIPTHPYVTTGSQLDFKEDSIISLVAEGTHTSLSMHLHDGTTSYYISISNTTEKKITAGCMLRGIYIRTEKNVEVNTSYKIMIRNADITDSTYEPYKPSLQEQINSLLARIAALETATTTTEGGE